MPVFLLRLAVSTHSRLKAAGRLFDDIFHLETVSTHSRLKAAGRRCIGADARQTRFNTQPPKGGWTKPERCGLLEGFNTQPPKGGWLYKT